MQRRQFITLLGGAAAWPLAAQGQARLPVIGFLASSSPDLQVDFVRAFRRALSETGYVEGQNVAIEYRWAEGRYDRLPELAADLVRRQVSVIAAVGGPSAPAAKAATSVIPIVFGIGGDPIQERLVTSLSRPGGNITGVTTLGTELGPKRLELLHELVPNAMLVGLLVNPSSPNARTLQNEMAAVAPTLGVDLHILHASSVAEIDAAFASFANLKVGGLVIGSDNFYSTQPKRLSNLALRYRLPAIFVFRDFVVTGGLVSYGNSQVEQNRLVANYIGRILKGEKPADLPVQQATKIELLINMKTAKTLGIAIPLSLLGRADEVIE